MYAGPIERYNGALGTSRNAITNWCVVAVLTVCFSMFGAEVGSSVRCLIYPRGVALLH